MSSEWVPLAGLTAALYLLALVDGACSGLRAGLGRSGLVDHRAPDRRNAREGALLAVATTTPGAVVLAVALLSGAATAADIVQAERAALAVIVPFAAVTLAALACYATLGWRRKYLAIAVILGPCTLVRPVVGSLAALAGILAAPRLPVAAATLLAATGVLLVEPLAARRRSS